MSHLGTLFIFAADIPAPSGTLEQLPAGFPSGTVEQFGGGAPSGTAEKQPSGTAEAQGGFPSGVGGGFMQTVEVVSPTSFFGAAGFFSLAT